MKRSGLLNQIFRDKVTAEAYVTATLKYSQPVTSSLQAVEIKVGSSFLLDGKSLTIDHLGDTKVILRGEDGLILWTHEQFQQLVKLGDITQLQMEEAASLDSAGWEYFVQASPEALAEANRRYAIIKLYLLDLTPIKNIVPKTCLNLAPLLNVGSAPKILNSCIT
jgi:hypothetical protein